MRNKWSYRTILMLLLFHFGSLMSQTTDTTQSPTNINQFKRWSLNFHMNQKFQWDQTHGNIVSGQYFIKPNLVLRLGLGGQYSYSTLERDQVRTHGDDKPTSTINSVDLYPTLLFYQKTAPFKFYWGLGSVFGFRQSENKTEQRKEGSGWQLMQKTEITGYNLGLQGVLGAEWRFQNYLFLFLEYNPKLVYRFQENDDMRTGETNIKTLKFYTNPVGLGIGILL